MQGIAVIDKAKKGLQQVVAIRTTANNMQKKVEFGGRGICTLPTPVCSTGQGSFLEDRDCEADSGVQRSMRRRNSVASPPACPVNTSRLGGELTLSWS